MARFKGLIPLLIAAAVMSFTDAKAEETVAQNGRATLALQDLKTLVGISARLPSNEDTQAEHLGGTPNFFLSLSNAEARKLSTRIRKLEMERAAISTQEETKIAKGKEEIRKKRREIQAKRIGTQESSDLSLGKSLYDNLLEESNLEAQAQEKLSKYDQENAISLDFIEINGNRHVESIRIGSTKVWTAQSSGAVAQR